jgi:hypothetical protein
MGYTTGRIRHGVSVKEELKEKVNNFDVIDDRLNNDI